MAYEAGCRTMMMKGIEIEDCERDDCLTTKIKYPFNPNPERLNRILDFKSKNHLNASNTNNEELLRATAYPHGVLVLARVQSMLN